MLYRPLLEEVINRLSKNPYIVLESALILPGCSEPVLIQFREELQLPSWFTQLYAEVGGAHIGWRLSPIGYEKLAPNRIDNLYRYDIFGNFDLLSHDEVIDGFTGSGWREMYSHGSQDYHPVDFSSYFLNLGYTTPFQPDDNTKLINIVYEDRLVQLDISLAEYLRVGADRLFIVDWQLTLLNDENYADQDRHIKQLAEFLVDESNY
jgi:hypothetical protein